MYRAGRENVNADTLSRSPQAPAPTEGIAEKEVQVPTVTAESSKASEDRYTLLSRCPTPDSEYDSSAYAQEQKKDACLVEIINFLDKGVLPECDARARKIATQSSQFAIVEDVLYYIDPKHANRKRAAVPSHLQREILDNTHSGRLGRHFSGNRLYNSLVTHWWWEGMYADAVQYAKSCPECALATGTSRALRPPLNPIPVGKPFQIIGVDVMELPKTERVDQYVIVFQDMFSKWLMVFAVPDQKAVCIAK